MATLQLWNYSFICTYYIKVECDSWIQQIVSEVSNANQIFSCELVFHFLCCFLEAKNKNDWRVERSLWFIFEWDLRKEDFHKKIEGVREIKFKGREKIPIQVPAIETCFTQIFSKCQSPYIGGEVRICPSLVPEPREKLGIFF